MPEKKKLLVVTDAAGEVVAVADMAVAGKDGTTVDIAPREGQKVFELEAPIELTKLPPGALKDKVSEALRVTGLAKEHVRIFPKRA